jgi:hypothetical protein
MSEESVTSEVAGSNTGESDREGDSHRQRRLCPGAPVSSYITLQYRANSDLLRVYFGILTMIVLDVQYEGLSNDWLHPSPGADMGPMVPKDYTSNFPYRYTKRS